ncbi:MAG: hypothetical protein JO272_15580 [Pseudonocardiales bacterium]|nr:hypothetical protein [Pseudonocardiales bacterium]
MSVASPSTGSTPVLLVPPRADLGRSGLCCRDSWQDGLSGEQLRARLVELMVIFAALDGDRSRWRAARRGGRYPRWTVRHAC